MLGTNLLLLLALLVLGVTLIWVGMSSSFRYNVLKQLRSGRSWNHNTEVMVTWLSWIAGMAIISMVVPYTVYMCIVVVSLIYVIARGR